MLRHARIEARIPTQDLTHTRRWYAEKLGLEPAEERPGGLRYGEVEDTHSSASRLTSQAGRLSATGRVERADSANRLP